MNRKGFTLIELLVVVLIIGILASVALPQYQRAVEKSRATEILTLFNGLTKAETIYKLSEGEFTELLPNLDLQFPNLSASNSFTTQSFEVEILQPTESSATRDTFLVRATRRTGPTYYLYSSIDKGGVIKSWCGVSDDQTVPTTLSGSEDAVVLCKNISNGGAKGEIN